MACYNVCTPTCQRPASTQEAGQNRLESHTACAQAPPTSVCSVCAYMPKYHVVRTDIRTEIRISQHILAHQDRYQDILAYLSISGQLERDVYQPQMQENHDMHINTGQTAYRKSAQACPMELSNMHRLAHMPKTTLLTSQPNDIHAIQSSQWITSKLSM